MRPLAIALLLSACDCGSSDHVAELASKQGSVSRDHDEQRETWEAAEPGARFRIGDAVRTAGGASAELSLGAQGARLRLNERTTVRFLRHRGNGAGVEVSTGRAEIEAGDQALSVTTQFGEAVLDAHSRARLVAQSQSHLRIAVDFGRAVFDEREIDRGNELSVSFGGAIVETEPPQHEAEPPQHEAEPQPETPETEPTPIVEPPPEAEEEITLARRSGRNLLVRGESGQWERLGDAPQAVAVGAHVRVPARASVTFRRGTIESVLEGQGEYVVGGEGGALLRALSGHVGVARQAGDVTIEVPGGRIVVRGGGEAHLDVRSRGTEVHAVAGTSQVDGDRDDDTLSAGERATLTREGGLSVGGRGPARVDLAIGAGASVTVHDPRPPTALGIRFAEACSGRGVVELMRGSRVLAASAGESQANLSLPAGAHAYRVRCSEGEGSAHGTVRVLRDSGIAPLPPSAPRNIVDTDGRTYRLLYQTHLPDLTVRWPRAPATGPYVLTVRPASGAPRTFSAAEARVELPSGTIGVGSHRLSFAGGGQTSRETLVEIRFDNAMPTASIREPADRSFAPGQSVHVAGIAVTGWRALVDGSELELDGQLRFEGTVTAPTAHDAIAIELRHPSRGRHFYLRRSQAP